MPPEIITFHEIARKLEFSPENPPVTHEDVGVIIRQAVEDGEFLGEGEFANVITDAPRDGDSEAPLFAIKAIERKTEKSELKHPLKREMALQAKARVMLEKARDVMPCARVPEPIFYAKTDDGKEFLAMERIMGKTLQRIILEKAWETKGMSIEDAEGQDDNYLIYRIFDGKMPSGSQREILLSCIQRINAPFLPRHLLDQFEQTLRVLHEGQFFHRDLHAKNIMVSDDLSRVYIIDFDLASSGQPWQEAQYHTDHFNAVRHQFIDDSQMVPVLKACVSS